MYQIAQLLCDYRAQLLRDYRVQRRCKETIR